MAGAAPPKSISPMHAAGGPAPAPAPAAVVVGVRVGLMALAIACGAGGTVPPLTHLYAVPVLIDGHNHTVPVFDGEEPRDVVETFADEHQLGGNQAQLLLNVLCAEAEASGFMCQESTVLRASLFLGNEARQTKYRNDWVRRDRQGRPRPPSALFEPVPGLAAPHRELPAGMQLTRAHLVEGREIYVADDVVEPALRRRWERELQNVPMRRMSVDAPLKDNPYYEDAEREALRAWVVDFDEAEVQESKHPIYLRVRALLDHLFPTETLVLGRVSANAVDHGGIYFPHTDYQPDTKHLTVIYYANDYWKSQWHGETILYGGPTGEEPMYAVAPRPGRVLAFRGAMRHRVGVPSKHCDVARLVQVFRFLSLAKN